MWVLMAAIALGCGRVQADQRSYVWTYEYLTLSRGEAELEYYFTISAPDSSNMKTNVTTQHKIEYEVGMTDHFDFGIYQVFQQAPGEAFRYEAFQLRARYRIGKKGQYLVDSLLYLEYEGVPDFSAHAIEAKWVLAKDVGRFNIAVNPTMEVILGDEDEVEFECVAGINFKTSDMLTIGMEAKGGEAGNYLGPVIAHGNGMYWSTLGTAFRVGDGEETAPEFQVRLLLGIGL